MDVRNALAWRGRHGFARQNPAVSNLFSAKGDGITICCPEDVRKLLHALPPAAFLRFIAGRRWISPWALPGSGGEIPCYELRVVPDRRVVEYIIDQI